jgi:hypothetical protein
MFRHLTTALKGKGKRKKDEGSSSSSKAQSDTSAFLFAVIVSFPFFSSTLDHINSLLCVI